jgi:nitrate reductase NapE component
MSSMSMSSVSGGGSAISRSMWYADRVSAIEENMGPRVRGFVAAIFGLWPITAVVLLAFGLMCIAMLQNAP